MALHELWISFRLIPLVGLPVVGGMLVSAVPPEFAGETAVGGAGFWYAVAAGVAICVASGLAALTWPTSAAAGRVAWMAVRAVPRAHRSSSLVPRPSPSCSSSAWRSVPVGAWLAAIARARHRPMRSPSRRRCAQPPGRPWRAVAAGLLIGTLSDPAGDAAGAAVSAPLVAWPSWCR